MLTKMYQIQVKHGGRYVPLEETEYSEQEVRDELSVLRRYHPEMKFRRHYLRTQDMVMLSVHIKSIVKS